MLGEAAQAVSEAEGLSEGKNMEVMVEMGKRGAPEEEQEVNAGPGAKGLWGRDGTARAVEERKGEW
jgi:hypothetical protein